MSHAVRSTPGLPARLGAALIVLLLAGCGGSGPSPGARPTPSLAGQPIGAPLAATLDAAGGTLASASGALTLVVPPGALSGPTELTVIELTNTAPGAAGSAWRLAPADLRLLVPARLSIVPGGALDGLTLAWQASGGGFWQRLRGATGDALAGTLSADVSHLGDFAAAAASTSRDLQGVVTLTSTLGPPVALTGALTLDYAGEDGGVAWYVLGGTLTAPASYADGADTCTVAAPDFPMRANLAELRAAPARFAWGLSGAWPVACTGPGGDRSDTLLLAFDDVGVALSGCPRTDLEAPISTPERVQGRQLADCGADGAVTAGWTFVTCLQGAACEAVEACHAGQVSCATAFPTCADAGPLDDGTPCGAVAGATCIAGACVAP